MIMLKKKTIWLFVILFLLFNIVNAIYFNKISIKSSNFSKINVDLGELAIADITDPINPDNLVYDEIYGYFNAANKIYLNNDGVEEDKEKNYDDADNDGLSDNDEINVYFTDPNNADSDNDGLSDGNEVNIYNSNPRMKDSDLDGINDEEEINTYNTGPMDADSDNDGINDGPEINKYHTDPLKADSDGDSLNDGIEINSYKTNPLNADSDGDNLNDGAEIDIYHTDPLDKDSDNDGITDGIEITIKMNPNSFLIPTGIGIVIITMVLIISTAVILKKKYYHILIARKKLRNEKQEIRKKQKKRQENQKLTPEDRIQKLKKIMEVSKSVPISRLAIMLDMDENNLWNKLIDWAAEFGFNIEGQNVIFSSGNLEGFLDSLDASFEEWDQKETSKEGKLE